MFENFRKSSKMNKRAEKKKKKKLLTSFLKNSEIPIIFVSQYDIFFGNFLTLAIQPIA